jgi:hypothetical protein
MASDTESDATSTQASPDNLANEFAEVSIDSGGTLSQFEELELPEHDEHNIHYGGKTYKRGKARPAKRRDRSPQIWYWNHGEEIAEGNQRRWMCEPCWKTKTFTHYAQTSNKAIVKHLKDMHGITQSQGSQSNVVQVQITPANDEYGTIAPSMFQWETL